MELLGDDGGTLLDEAGSALLSADSIQAGPVWTGYVGAEDRTYQVVQETREMTA